MISPLLCLTIGYACARRHFDDLQSRIVSMICLISFMIVCPLMQTDSGMGINLVFMGARGMFVGIFIAFLLAGYTLCVKYRIVIRLPESVPPFISKSFESIVPGAIIFLLAAFCAYGFAQTDHGSLVNFIYAIIQKPFEAISGNIHGYILITFLIQLFWFFGIHGGMTFDAIKNTLFTQAALDNMAAYSAGTAMTHIVTIGFSELAGSGWAQGIGLLICMIFFCKEKISRRSEEPRWFRRSSRFRNRFVTGFQPYSILH